MKSVPDHDHGSAPHFLPHWMQDHWSVLTVAGVALAIGFFGETFFGLPSSVALGFYLLSYVAGGYDVAREAIPALFLRKLDIDILMLAAAAGAALLGQWAEGAFLLFLFSLGHAGEHYAMDRARNAVGSLGKLMPRTAFTKRSDLNIEEGSEIRIQGEETKVSGKKLIVAHMISVDGDSTRLRDQSERNESSRRDNMKTSEYSQRDSR